MRYLGFWRSGGILALATVLACTSFSSANPPGAQPTLDVDASAGDDADAEATDGSAPDASSGPSPADAPNPYGVPYPKQNLGGKPRSEPVRGQVLPNIVFDGLPAGSSSPTRVSFADIYDPESRTHDLAVVCLMGLRDNVASQYLELMRAGGPQRVAHMLLVGEGPVVSLPPTLQDLVDARSNLLQAMWALDNGHRALGGLIVPYPTPTWIYLDARTMEIVAIEQGALAADMSGHVRSIRDQVKARPPAY